MSLETLPHPADADAWDARMKADFLSVFPQITLPKAIEPLPGFPINQSDED